MNHEFTLLQCYRDITGLKALNNHVVSNPTVHAHRLVFGLACVILQNRAVPNWTEVTTYLGDEHNSRMSLFKNKMKLDSICRQTEHVIEGQWQYICMYYFLS